MTHVNSKWIDTQWCRLRPSYFPSSQHLTQLTTKEDVLNVQVILGGQLIHLSPGENAKTKSCAQMLVTKNLQKHDPFSNEEVWYINFFRSWTVFGLYSIQLSALIGQNLCSVFIRVLNIGKACFIVIRLVTSTFPELVLSNARHVLSQCNTQLSNLFQFVDQYSEPNRYIYSGKSLGMTKRNNPHWQQTAWYHQRSETWTSADTETHSIP